MNHLLPFSLFESVTKEVMELDIKDALYDIVDEYDMYQFGDEILNNVFGIYYQLKPYGYGSTSYILSIYFFSNPTTDFELSNVIGKKFNALLDDKGNSNIYTFKSRLESMGYNVNFIRYTGSVDIVISDIPNKTYTENIIIKESIEHEEMGLNIKDVLYDLIDEYDMYEVEGNYRHEIYGICYQFYPMDDLSYFVSIFFFKNPDEKFNDEKKFNNLLNRNNNNNIYTFKSRLESMGYSVDDSTGIGFQDL